MMNAKDSSIYKGTLTDENGKFTFTELKAGDYFLKIEAIGYELYRSQIIRVDSSKTARLEAIRLTTKGTMLEEVTVSAIRKPIEFKNGNFVVNVEDSPLAIGNSVYDLLSRMPGVTVDNDQIMIQGKSGVVIQMDGRRQPLSGQQLINMLRSMSAASVSKIEIIRNPSAKYDAAGTAGIINIISKRLKITGTSGTAGYSLSKGYSYRNNGNLSLNYKGKHVSVFSGIDAFEGTYKFQNDLLKTVPVEGGITTLDSRSNELDVANYATVNLGLDWYVDSSNTIGFRMQAIPGRARRTRQGNNAMSDSLLGYEDLIFKRTITNDWFLANYNLNSEHRLDTNGTKLKSSMDFYGPYRDFYHTDYDYRFNDRAQQEVKPSRMDKADNYLDLRIASASVDFEKKLAPSLTMETGVKGSYQDIISNYEFWNLNRATSEFTPDTLFTNRYVYHEIISAAYVNLNKEYKKFSYQLGLRGEDTRVESRSELRRFLYTRHYFKLFPNVALNYNPSTAHSWSAVFNRRLWRPDYNSFNPYYTFNSLFSISRGNPYLLPEFYYNVELTHIYKSKLTTTFSLSRSQSPIRGQTQQDDSSRITYFQLGNLQRSNEGRLFIFYSGDVAKWWQTTVNLGGWYYDFYGMVDGKLLNNHAFSYSAWTNQIFLLSKNTKLEVSGWFVGPWLYGGFYWIRPRGALNFAMKHTFMNNKLTVSAGAYDIFYSAINHSDVHFNNQNFTSLETYDSRVFKVSLNYNFGSVKVEQRSVKRADEQNRIGK
jgi:iron complex outermembrane receptor protein